MSETTSREFFISMKTFEKLLEIQKKRGFPEKPISESSVVEEAIEKLYAEEVKVEQSK